MLTVQAAYAACRAKGLSGTTVALVHGTLHKALDDAARWSLVARNVADLVDAPRRSTPEMRTLTPEEAGRLLAAAQGDHLEAFFVTALTTGLRLGELQALQWRNVDLDRRRLRVTATLAAVEDGKPVLAPPKTSKSRREVYLSEIAADALHRHRVRQLEGRLLAAQHWQDNDLVFANAFGRALDANNVRERSFKRLLETAGLPPMRFHNLRHAAASLLMAEGVPVKVISEMLGHADITVTLKVYAHLLPTAQEQAAKAMDQLFGVGR
jgi:integrase